MTYLSLKIQKLGIEECEICFASYPSNVSIYHINYSCQYYHEKILQMMTGLACGHRFCTSCWCEYLTTKILEEGLGQSIACAAHDCDILVDDVTVMTLVTDQRVKSRYQKTVTNSFVEVIDTIFFIYKKHLQQN